jgi:hypothetical protein
LVKQIAYQEVKLSNAYVSIMVVAMRNKVFI